jgi:CRP-like cAMP-binding protein
MIRFLVCPKGNMADTTRQTQKEFGERGRYMANAATRPKTALNQGFSASLALADEEVAALLDLKTTSRTIRRGQEIVSEGRRCSTLSVITEGIAIRYRILRDGQRQILNFLLPGDFAGLTSCFFETALYSIRAITPTIIFQIPFTAVIELLDQHPGLAAGLFRLFASEAAIRAEHLIGIGRLPGLERVAHFLLELLARLRAKGLADERSYGLPLTREVISDALGMSVRNVNRVLQQLRTAGLVRIEDHVVVIENIEELSVLADFEHGYLRPLAIAELAGERG